MRSTHLGFVALSLRVVALGAILISSTLVAVSQDHKGSYLVDLLLNWQDQQHGLRSPLEGPVLRIPTRDHQKYGQINWFFAASRENGISREPSPDFQLTIALFDSAAVLYLEEARGGTLSYQFDRFFSTHPSRAEQMAVRARDSLVNVAMDWFRDTADIQLGPKVTAFIEKLQRRFVPLIPAQASGLEDVAYRIYTFSWGGVAFTCFARRATGSDGEPLSEWIDSLLDTTRDFIHDAPKFHSAN